MQSVGGPSYPLFWRLNSKGAEREKSLHLSEITYMNASEDQQSLETPAASVVPSTIDPLPFAPQSPCIRDDSTSLPPGLLHQPMPTTLPSPPVETMLKLILKELRNLKLTHDQAHTKANKQLAQPNSNISQLISQISQLEQRISDIEDAHHGSTTVVNQSQAELEALQVKLDDLRID
ncbi:hypothetical protein NDU88_003310 [Pleurodeles waltl]|uniref:Uncharacterized protein n=1 Tax=Pleurodeles waltl TaxID=8319 RepID=A0AAV7W1S1_PLEWA|nr:hypothetical protein NDU88_003310 [Pleurodeles waltl]